MINKFKTFLLLGILIIGFVFVSGCVQEKAPAPTETVTHLPTVATPKTVTVLIEDTDPSFEYSTECVIQENLGASGGSWIACPDEGQPPAIGATVNVTFTGTAVSLIYLKGPYCGIANVEIDGKTYPEIDTYSDEMTVAKTKIAEDLPNTQHTLKIVVSDEKNQDSGSNLLIIDAIEITTLQ